MWDSQGSRLSQQYAGARTAGKTRPSLQILPCTVSQLLSSSKVDSYIIGGREIKQASIVGVIRRSAPFKNGIRCAVDDMTGPPVAVTLWVNPKAADPVMLCDTGSPGTYVKVVGNLRSHKGGLFLVAHSMRCLEDLNEITSHMLEVVQAHMLPSERVDGTPSKVVAKDHTPRGLSTIQSQVLNVINMCPYYEGIRFDDLATKLDFLSFPTIRRCLEFLMQQGTVFQTIDEQHFKSAGSG